MSYDETFYASIHDDARRSAAVVVPKFLDLVQPKSVIDVGCGMGQFLDIFMQLGVNVVLGVDGHDLLPDVSPFPYRKRDLTEPFADLGKFDLALSLEVAEHLPPECADVFVGQLCALAPVVLFSAACPEQGGEGHLNEQWPDYWADLFREHGFNTWGHPRYELWGDTRIAYWYRQNMMLYVSDDHDSARIAAYVTQTGMFGLAHLIHPVLYGNRIGVKFE